MSNYQNKHTPRSDLTYWIVSIALICTGIAAPIGFLMIVLKLVGGKKQGFHPYSARQGQYGEQGQQTPTGARTTVAPPTNISSTAFAKKPKRTVNSLKKTTITSRFLTIMGCFIIFFFFFGFLFSIGDCISWLFNGRIDLIFNEITDLLLYSLFLGIGLGCVWSGQREKKKARRYRGYLAMIGRRQSVSIASLASAMGTSTSKVRDDLADMLSDGILSQGFLDYGSDLLVLSGDGLQDEPPKQQPTPETKGEPSILEEIRAVNDAIKNEKLSYQIDQIGAITAKILEYQKNRPEKAAQLHSFLSYYLPTTLKILRAYAQLEAQEVSGANITAAMARIEGMMDKVVDGFEKQLDQLFQGETMDITTDVEVLERMLSKDGLSASRGMTLEL